MIEGHCLCGAIRFVVTGTPKGVSICHCGQCRRTSGHLWASAWLPCSEIEITGTPRWYASSPGAKRGFCPTCGASLFWKANDADEISFAMGALNETHDLRLEKHIFTADKGCYYDITDGLPQE